MHLRIVLWVLCGVGLSACADYGRNAAIPPDPHSFAQPNKAVATHLQWRGEVDFATQSIIAKASWVIQAQKDADTIVFDTYGLDIEKVTLDDQQETGWILENHHPILGSALRIAIKPGSQMVHIQYCSTSKAKGLQWLDAAQTSDKKHPFLFSQGQAILTRTWLPCQDSPSLRFSFDASVKVPAGLMALMSAPNGQHQSEDGTYQFSNPKPIPSYLFSLAVGDFSYKAFDGRSGIYAEKSTLDAAWQEFANLPPMIKAAERLFGKMPWERFDILVLPPSFPFGGMENPMIMFATPTLLAGDRSLTNLVAHELAHAWADKLVIPANWEHYWLNEFFTNYIERRIVEEIEGSSYAEMMETLSNIELELSIAKKLKSNENTLLAPNLIGKNPDLVLEGMIYHKGAALMMRLESALGKKQLDQWLLKQLKTADPNVYSTEAFIREYTQPLWKAALIEQAEVSEWLYNTGLPGTYKRKASTRFTNVETVAALWQANEPVTHLPTAAWSVYEWLYFLKIIQSTPISHDRLRELDKTMSFSNSGNAELQSVWFRLALSNNYLEILHEIDRFLAQTGRRKLLLVVYQALVDNAETAAFAKARFQAYSPTYHKVARESILELLTK